MNLALFCHKNIAGSITKKGLNMAKTPDTLHFKVEIDFEDTEPLEAMLFQAYLEGIAAQVEVASLDIRAISYTEAKRRFEEWRKGKTR